VNADEPTAFHLPVKSTGGAGRSRRVVRDDAAFLVSGRLRKRRPMIRGSQSP
jgi:hypothetical protein